MGVTIRKCFMLPTAIALLIITISLISLTDYSQEFDFTPSYLSNSKHLQSERINTFTDSSNVNHWIYEPRKGTETDSEMLVLTIAHNEESYGLDSDNNKRSFLDHLELIYKRTDYSHRKTTLGILTSSENEFSYIKKLLMHPPNGHPFYLQDFNKVHLMYHPNDFKIQITRDNRHASELQKERRRQISQLRNYLMVSTITKEKHVLWYDADVYQVDEGLVARMIDIAENNILPKRSHPNATIPEQFLPPGILTARCEVGGQEGSDYDKNAWTGPRLEPTEEEKEKLIMDPQYVFVPGPAEKGLHFEDLVEVLNDNDDIVHLDSVGGTILYIKGDLIRFGITFSPFYVVGTTWDSLEGYDGIETESICYAARSIGFGCYGLGGRWKINHSSN